MAGYSKTYTLDFTSSGDTVYTGTDKLEDNIDSIITWVNDLKDNYSAASAPTSPTPDEGQLWWDSTNKQFSVYTDSAWSATALNGFPSGTKMLFYQDTAPSGWTIDTSVNDKVAFITKGSSAGGEAGGGAHSTGSWTISGLSGDSHTLTTAEIPAHTHNTGPILSDVAFLTGISTSKWKIDETTQTQASSSTGGGGGHTHTVSSTGAWRIAAYCTIVAEKD